MIEACRWSFVVGRGRRGAEAHGLLVAEATAGSSLCSE